jgi:hypothetical protein
MRRVVEQAELAVVITEQTLLVVADEDFIATSLALGPIMPGVVEVVQIQTNLAPETVEKAAEVVITKQIKTAWQILAAAAEEV